MKLFLKCSETAHLCDKSQYRETGFFENLRIRIHLLLCACCRAYFRRNQRLTRCIEACDIQTLSEEEKNLLKKEIEENSGS